MNERMLDKNHQPSEEEIEQFIGNASCRNLQVIKEKLNEIFDLNIDLKFPFGNSYGWGYKFSHKSKHLFYIFFENNGLTLTTQINEPKTDRDRNLIGALSEEGRKCWETKYPCNNGGWVHYRFNDIKGLHDAGIFVSLRTKKDINFN
ncbi:MAG: DUF3788 family protein [Treponema sp.]